MTDSSDPRSRKPSRKKPSREPATIDLKATVIDDGTQPPETREDAQDPAPDTAPAPDTVPGDVAPAETISAEAEPQPENRVESSEATLDSAAGTDAIPTEDSPQDQPVQDFVSPEAAAQDPSSSGMPSQAAPERRSSPAALIGSGLLGGLIGAGIIYGLQNWQNPPAQDDQRLAQLEQRVNALGRPGPAPQGSAGAPQANLQAVEERIRTLEAARGSLDQRLQALQSTAEQASARAQEALNRPVPEAPAAPPPQNDAAVTDLTNRLSALEGRVGAAAQEAAGAAQNVAAATSAAQALERRLADLEGRSGEQQQRAAERDRRLTEQDQRLAALSQQVAEGNKGAQAAGQAALRVVLSDRLGDALRRGEPYADVLDALRKTGANPDQAAALEPFAQKGAPTGAALAQSFEPVETAILREERAAAGPWTDRLRHMMDQVVTVRRVNEPGSNDVSGTVDRIRQALERGDIGGAAAAWAALPEPARRVSEDWGRQVTAAAAAQQASNRIAADSLAALNRTTP